MRPWQKRWFWWVAGSILIAVVSSLLTAMVGSDVQTDGRGGIHLRAFGIFSASNHLVINNDGKK